jgi:hypothetical protein
MRHLVKKIGSSDASILGRFEIGPRKMDLITKNSSFKIMLDGYEIYSMDHTASSPEDIAVVVGEILDNVSKNANVTKIKSIRIPDSLKSDIDPDIFFSKTAARFSGVLEFIEKSSSSKNIKLVMAPDTEIDVTSNPEFMIRRLLDLRNKIKSLAGSCQDLIDITQGVTRRRLVDTMWGASSVQKIIDALRGKIGDSCWNKIDLHTELMDKAILRMMSKLRTDLLNACKEEKILIFEVIIPEIITNFESLKSLVSKLMTCVAPIINIDEIFKKFTSYPGKFFISDGAIEEIQETFEGLLEFVQSIPEIESDTIIPLDVFGNKILNDLKGQ